MRICDGSSFFISREGQAHGALLYHVQQELPVCSEGRGEAWDVEKGKVEHKVQKCILGLSSS